MLCTHTHTTVLRLSGFCPDNTSEPVPEEKFTNSRLSWSSVMPYLLHVILRVQLPSLTVFFHNLSLQVFFGLPIGLAPSTSYSTHFFTQSSSFRSTCSSHCNLFYCSTEIMSSNPGLSLSLLLGTPML